MFPCSMRRRSWSADESMSSTWSALRTTQSGTRSRTSTPVIDSTVSARLSMCWMLTVLTTAMPAPSSVDVLPPLFVGPRAGNVRVRQLVDQHQFGPSLQHGRHVHLLELGAPVTDTLAGHHLEVPDQLLGVRAPVGLDEADHHVAAALGPAPPLVEHGAGLADPGRRAQVQAEPAGRAYGVVVDVGPRLAHRPILPDPRTARPGVPGPDHRGAHGPTHLRFAGGS